MEALRHGRNQSLCSTSHRHQCRHHRRRRRPRIQNRTRFRRRRSCRLHQSLRRLFSVWLSTKIFFSSAAPAPALSSSGRRCGSASRPILLRPLCRCLCCAWLSPSLLSGHSGRASAQSPAAISSLSSRSSPVSPSSPRPSSPARPSPSRIASVPPRGGTAGRTCPMDPMSCAHILPRPSASVLGRTRPPLLPGRKKQKRGRVMMPSRSGVSPLVDPWDSAPEA
mmetsp:Transcript_18751/g.36149  ORF Transcript_18751/g.36149 Transcript_18751/m.36149 type:complete len:223 (-) Transcript_18751:173-841(-)